MLNDIEIFCGSWQELNASAKTIRTAVFINEQHIAEADEWEALDAVSIHFIVRLNGQAIATARLLQNNSIGRVAVLREYRGLGVGYKLMQFIIALAQQQHRPFVKLSSQVHAVGFYENLGFVVEGEQYLDCGIPHIDMRLRF